MEERSFKNYVIENMKNTIIDSIWKYIEDNKESIYKKYNVTDKVVDIINKTCLIKKDEIVLKGINELGDIEYIVRVHVGFELCYDSGKRESKNIKFELECRSDIYVAFDNIEIIKIKIGHYQHKSKSFLKNNLFCYLNDKYQEIMAEKILKRYYQWDASSLIKINPDVLAEKLGLKIIEIGIKKEFSVFGQIYFEKTNTKLYDLEKERYIEVEIEAKTIVIDPRIEDYRGEGAKNNTKIHECVHWILHRNTIKLMNRQGFICGVKDVNEVINRLEYQAEALTPKIFMPRDILKAKVEELLIKSKEKESDQNIFVLEKIINQLSELTGVSKSSVRLRLYELGYTEVLGVLNYIDGKYIPAHCKSDGSMSKDKSFCISEEDLLYQMAFSPKLNKVLSEESYVYVESHLCKNKTDYVYIDENRNYVLTEYARTHMEECCIEFNVFYKASEAELLYASMLNKGKKRVEVGIVIGLEDSENKAIHESIYKLSRKMPKEFDEALKFLIKSLGRE